MKKIVFFGAGDFVIPVVETLRNQRLILVITTETTGKFIEYLTSNNIEFISGRLLDEGVIKKLQALHPGVGILASYGALIPQEIIDLFPLGILNIHPSLLPKFKGPAPVPYTITAGEAETGVTIIQMDDKLDHGPIVAQERMLLQGNETSQELLELLFLKSAEMVQKIVQDINSELKIESNPQDPNNESWSEKLEKEDGKIDLKNPPKSDELDRKIRAFYPWPGVYLTASLKGQEKQIKLLPQGHVQVEGKNPMSYKDFINGYGKEAEEILNKLQLPYVN